MGLFYLRGLPLLRRLSGETSALAAGRCPQRTTHLRGPDGWVAFRGTRVDHRDRTVPIWSYGVGFDAIVLGPQETRVRLFEPAHGEVLAHLRRPERQYRTGSRAYLSAGLPGADWWVAGPGDVPAEEADVELDDVDAVAARLLPW